MVWFGKVTLAARALVIFACPFGSFPLAVSWPAAVAADFIIKTKLEEAFRFLPNQNDLQPRHFDFSPSRSGCQNQGKGRGQETPSPGKKGGYGAYIELDI